MPTISFCVNIKKHKIVCLIFTTVPYKILPECNNFRELMRQVYTFINNKLDNFHIWVCHIFIAFVIRQFLSND